MPARETIFSSCRTWRYVLWRSWDPNLPYAMFMGLNPSTADETVNDPTILREMNLAQRWGFGALAKWNLFGFRTPYPRVMKTADDPVGPDNDAHLAALAIKGAGIIVAGWGNDGVLQNRAQAALAKLTAYDVHALKINATGQPKHPLYIKRETKPFVWRPASN